MMFGYWYSTNLGRFYKVDNDVVVEVAEQRILPSISDQETMSISCTIERRWRKANPEDWPLRFKFIIDKKGNMESVDDILSHG